MKEDMTEVWRKRDLKMVDMKLSEKNMIMLCSYANLFADDVRELAGKNPSKVISKNNIMQWIVDEVLPAYEEMKKKEESEENGK